MEKYIYIYMCVCVYYKYIYKELKEFVVELKIII